MCDWGDTALAALIQIPNFMVHNFLQYFPSFFLDNSVIKIDCNLFLEVSKQTTSRKLSKPKVKFQKLYSKNAYKGTEFRECTETLDWSNIPFQ